MQQLFMPPDNILQRCISMSTMKLHKREIVEYPQFHITDLYDGLSVLVKLR